MSTHNGDVPADDAASEQPVREQLRKAKIEAETKAVDEASASESILAETGAHAPGLENGASTTAQDTTDRGRPTRKRSFDETEEVESAGAGRAPSARQPRKRSRENPDGSESRKVSGEHPRDATGASVNGTSNELKKTEETAPVAVDAPEPAENELGSPKTKRSKIEDNGAPKAEIPSDAALPIGAAAQTDEKSETDAQPKPSTFPQGQVSNFTCKQNVRY